MDELVSIESSLTELASNLSGLVEAHAHQEEYAERLRTAHELAMRARELVQREVKRIST